MRAMIGRYVRVFTSAFLSRMRVCVRPDLPKPDFPLAI